MVMWIIFEILKLLRDSSTRKFWFEIVLFWFSGQLLKGTDARKL